MSQSADSSTAPAGSSPPDQAARYQSLLATNERVLLVRRRHWVMFVRAARWFLLVLMAALLLGILDAEASSSFLNTVLGWGAGACLLVGLAGTGWFFLEWRLERYLVTTTRVIEIGGVINKQSRDTSLAMITDMLVSHPWIGRLLGYGEIDLLTASEVGTNKIRYLPDADGFKRALLDAKDEHERELAGGSGAPPSPAPVPTAPPAGSERLNAEEVDSAISHLADLRDRGLITPEEFEEKKRQILDRL